MNSKNKNKYINKYKNQSYIKLSYLFIYISDNQVHIFQREVNPKQICCQ